MTRKIPQPPIDPRTRPTEQHDFWAGGVITIVGLLVLITGLRHLTGVETLDGNSAWETQLVKAFSTGGLRYADATAAAPPVLPDNPADAVATLDRARKADTEKRHAIGRVRVDVGASTPCPT
ncbi:MAG: hypothetical protein GX456_05385 [Verrucomicrobia bacterium]|nr:hypothetical protein [Verrucomicrobiota bacterium]